MEILNSCGKEVFQISDLSQVKRFLSLGSDNGTYYIKAVDLTKMNIESIERILDSKDREKLLSLIEDYATNRKCKKQEPLIYLLARCCTYESSKKDRLKFREDAYKLVEKVCTIPTTLFMFCKYCKYFYNKYAKSNGWNNLHKRAITSWYKERDLYTLIYQVTKYKDREGYTHRDILRLAHIYPEKLEEKIIYRYIAKGVDELNSIFIESIINNTDVITDNKADKIYNFIMDYERLKKYTDIDMAIDLIEKWNFAREHIPTELLNNMEVWTALLPTMPDIALLRNLNKMTLCGLFKEQSMLNLVCDKIGKIKNIHPMNMLISLKMYDNGKGFKGSNTWTPEANIVSALDKQFYKLFNECSPTGARICIAMDVSGSMHCAQALGTECMNAAEISCALAMVMKHVDSTIDIMGFSRNFVKLDIDPKNSLADNLRKIRNLPFESTDISKPFSWAIENNKKYDVFIVLTDNETNSNKIKPIDALRKYRSEMKIPNCKLVVVAMTANNFSIADPNDKNMLDIAGFDSSVPELINSFINDEL